MEKESNGKSFLIQVFSGLVVLAVVYLVSKFKLKKEEPKEEIKTLSKQLKKMTKEEFTKFLSPSVRVMAEKTGIPYSFMMAQIALETGWGKSELFWKYNNVGGIRSFHPETETHSMQWTHEHILKTEIDAGKFPQRNKAKDLIFTKNGKTYVDITIQLPFRTFPDMVTGLKFYLEKVLLNKYFRNYVKESGGNVNKYIELLQSGKYGAKYATAQNYVPTMQGMVKQFA